MRQAIRIGIAGLGQRGLQHLGVLWKLQEEGSLRIVALNDAFAENLDDAKILRYVPAYRPEGIRLTTCFADMLAPGDLDAVWFALPPSVHRGEVVAAANRGLHLFVEKPMSLYLDEAAEMEAAIRANGVLSTVGFQQRYDSRSEAAHRFLADKKTIMVTMIAHSPLESHSVKHTATEKLGGPANRVWTANREWSGSTVVEAGIHQTDLMRYWCGEIEWVQARYVHRDPDDIADGGDNPYAYTVTFGFQNGGVGNLILSRLRKTYISEGYQTILWTHGHLKFEGGEVVAYCYDGPYPPDSPPRPEALRHPLPLPPRADSTEQINRTFVKALITSDSGDLRSTFSSGMNSLAAVLGANVSDQLGGERIVLRDLLGSDRFAAFRKKPASMP